MNIADVYSLPGRDNPVLCKDGKMAMLIIYPNEEDFLCGVQIPGDESIRWIACAELNASKEALWQDGSPFAPDMNAADLAQRLLAHDWTRRVGPRKMTVRF